MKYFKISIITPSYNQGLFIEKTIKSVLSQKYPNLEYIILDNCSTDQTSKILRSHVGARRASPVQIIIKKDKGQVNAINNGLKIASGDILAYLNADDVLAPNSLFVINDFFLKNKSAKIVTGKCEIIDEKDNLSRKFLTLVRNIFPSKYRYKYPVINIINLIAQPSTFWRNEITKTIGYFNDDYHLAFDYEYFLRISQKYPIHFIPNLLSYFRVHTSQKSSDHKKHFEEDYQIASHYTKNPLIKFLAFLSRQFFILTYRIIDL